LSSSGAFGNPSKERSDITSFSLWGRANKQKKDASLPQDAKSGEVMKKKHVFGEAIKARFHRDTLDIGLLVRHLPVIRVSPRVLRIIPRGRFSILKEYVVHMVVLLIVGGVVVTSYATEAADRGSMLFRLFSDAEIEEGPLNTKALREAALSSVTGKNYALAQVPSSGGITENDLEFQLSNTLDGNALISTEQPITSTTSDEQKQQKGTFAYTVREGDTPSTIAARFGVSTNTIMWANGISDGDVIKTGDILVVLPITGILHEVKKGDDLSTIAKKYDVNVEDVAKQNNLKDSASLKIGQKLIVPDGYISTRANKPIIVAEAPEEVSPPEEEAPPAEEKPSTQKNEGGFIWPTTTRKLSQYFGWHHTGIDIPNRALPPIFAAKSGKVAFSGWLGGYGHLIILDHGDSTRTYYAHLSQDYVKVGESVKQGETIGKMGSTGRSTGPHLHFEIRKNGKTVNPLSYF